MEHVKDMLSEYLDKELPELELRKVQSHLAECGECRSELEDLRSVCRIVREIPRQGLPLGFLSRLEARRREAGGPSAFGFFAVPQFRYAAAALTSLLVVFVIYDRAKTMFPLPGAQPMISGAADESRPAGVDFDKAGPAGGALEALSEAGSCRPSRALAKAKGAPYAGGSAGARGAAVPARKPAPAAEAKRERADYTNEALQSRLEREKSRMGILKIVPPEPRRFGMGLLASEGGSMQGQDIQMLFQAAPPATIAGNTPAILSMKARREAGGPAAASAAPEADEEAAPAGAAVRSASQQAELWRSRGLKDPPPAVDYSREMLVVAWGSGGQVAISEARSQADKILVLYREAPPQAADKKEARPDYGLKVVPASDLPVVFEKLP